MDYKVEFTETFLDDLRGVLRLIAKDNPQAAQRLGERIVERGEELSFFPERYPRLRERPALRRYLVAKHYKIFYRIRANERVVEILRCLDGRRGFSPAVE